METRTFTDIDLTFEPHPNTGDLLIKTDENAIKNSVKNLILTRHYERHFHSEIGSSVYGMLFELPSPGLVALLDQEIRNVIENFEPRVVVEDVNILVDNDNNTLLVTLFFRIVNTSREVSLNLTLRRVL